jgi:sugar-specific transcriptional regulator TrmB
MYIELFEALGLSPNESKIYESLLELGQASVGKISTDAKIHRRNVYDALTRLVHKGLVFPIFQKGENEYQPARPEKLLEIVSEKERELKKALPDLQALYSQNPFEESAFIYKGMAGYRNYMHDMVRTQQESYFLSAKGLWHSSKEDTRLHHEFINAMRQKKLSYFFLFDPQVPKKLPEALQEVDDNYKILPEAYATPGVVDVFGDYVVTYNSTGVGKVGEDVTIFVMKNETLAQNYKIWCRMIWDLLPTKK